MAEKSRLAQSANCGNRRGKQVSDRRGSILRILQTTHQGRDGNRLTKERLDFICYFGFSPSHADQLPVRESKKERTQYEAQLKETEEGRTESV